MIQFYANRRWGSCLTDDRLTTGSVGLAVRFSFSEEWEGLAKVAVFRGSGRSVDVHLSGESCPIPPEVLTEAGDSLRIGVYGTDGESVVIPTVYAEAGRIVPGAEPSGVEPEERTQPLIDQLLAAAQAALQTAQSVRDDAESGAFDGADGAPGPQGPQGPVGPQGSQGPAGPQGPAYVLTTADKADIVDDVLAALPTWQGGNY